MKIKAIPSIVFLWVGQGISSIGSAVYNVALAWYVIQLTNSPLKMGTLLFVAMIPKIIFSLLSGVIGDRVSKKSFLVKLDICRFLLAIIWAISMFHRPVNLFEIYIFTLIFSVMDSFFNPIYSSLIPELLEKGKLNLTKAASINQMIFRISMIIAPSLAGLLITVLNFAEFVLINGFSFIFAALCTMFIKYKKIEIKTNETKNTIFYDMKKGINFFINERIIFWSVILITFANIAAVSYNVNLANLIKNELNWDSSLYGITLTFYSLGSFLGVLILSLINVKKNRGLLYVFFLLIGGALFVLIKVSLYPMLLISLFFSIGLSFAVVSTISTTILFEVPSEEFRARVLGIASISNLLSPIGFLLWGMVGEKISSSMAMSLSGFVIIIVAITGLFTKIKSFN